MKPVLTIEDLIQEAARFCRKMSEKDHPKLLGVTDGKAVGTYVEHKFQHHLEKRYTVTIGSSAKGIDLPDAHIQTDIKVTSLTQPQSSCPFREARQKIYGLGYHLLVFVYQKQDEGKHCSLSFPHCAFIHRDRTADYTMTRRLRELAADGAGLEDIAGFLADRGIPGDELVHRTLAEEVLAHPPEQGYLTISNAPQWRLQYTKAISLQNSVDGVVNYGW